MPVTADHSDIRRVLLLGLLGLLLLWEPAMTRAQGAPPPAGDDREAARLLAPVGLIADAGMTEIRLAWVNAPGTTLSVRGYLTYYWPVEAGFRNAHRYADTPTPEQAVTLSGLEPDTTYRVAVRAATRTATPGLERLGDWYLSPFSDPVSVRTAPPFRLTLLGGSLGRRVGSDTTPARAVIRVERYQTEDQTWRAARFIVLVGESVGEPLHDPDAGLVDYHTGYQLEDLAVVTVAGGDRPGDLQPILGPDGQPFGSPGSGVRLPRPAGGSEAGRSPVLTRRLRARLQRADTGQALTLLAAQ